jgi:hypothetical protein
MINSLQSIKVLCPNNILDLSNDNNIRLNSTGLHLTTRIFHENMTSI